jgi:hypothetical protein
MKLSSPVSAALLCWALSLLLPPAAFSQDFSSIDRDLIELENLIQDTKCPMGLVQAPGSGGLLR